MRIVILSYESLYSSLMIGHVLRARRGLVSGIVLSSCIVQGKGLLGSISHVLRRAGPEFFLLKSIETVEYKGLVALWRLLGKARRVLSVEETARRHDVPVTHSADVNAPGTLAWIAARRPDAIASVYLNQWIGEGLLDLAPSGCINIHPALLPRHRGLFPYFWVLADGDSETGVTVHRVDSRFDTGPILAQERMPVRPNDTIQSLSYRSAEVGGPLLVRALEALAAGDPGQAQGTDGACYHSWPTSEAYGRFRRAGRRFGSLAELTSYL